MFQLFLKSNFYPQARKTATIIPVPKTLIRNELTHQGAGSLDPRQFAYQTNRGVEDATLTLLNSIYSHLDKPNTHAGILFMDFSSAFNTVQPHLLLGCLRDLKVSGGLVLHIREFLRARPQQVCIKNCVSDSLVLNTGVPQGLSLLLFSIQYIHTKYSATAVTSPSLNMQMTWA